LTTPRSWWVRAVLATSACVALGPIPVSAHDLPSDRPIPTYVKIGPTSVQLLIRIALDTPGLSLPTIGSRIDADASLPSLQDTLRKFGDAVVVFEGNSTLEATRREIRLSLPSDRSFDTYASASAHLEDSLAAAALYANQGFLDARLTYPITHGGTALSIQSRFTDTWGAAPVLSVVFLPIEGPERRFVLRGSTGQIAFTPSVYEAMRRSFAAGLTMVFASAEYLLLLICLVVPLRTFRDSAPVVAAAIGAYATAAVVSGLALVRVDDAFGQVVAVSATVVVAAAAVFNLVEPVLLRRWVLAAVAGAVCGFAAADAVHEQRVLAGAHSFVSVVGLNVGAAAGQVLVVAAVALWAQLFVHGSATARLRVLLISAIVADIAWHWGSQRAAPLWQAGWDYSGPSLVVLARAVAGVLLVAGVAPYLVRAAAPRAGGPAVAARAFPADRRRPPR
jgi:hypothetical protein